jgi:hypothetical protein
MSQCLLVWTLRPGTGVESSQQLTRSSKSTTVQSLLALHQRSNILVVCLALSHDVLLRSLCWCYFTPFAIEIVVRIYLAVSLTVIIVEEGS